jgi:predicted metalloendopeptidase
MTRASSSTASARRSARAARARQARCAFRRRHDGENVGRLYVARYFPADAKAKAQDLVRNLLAVYRQRVQTADWMSPETRRQALEKVGTFSVKIGYPDQWRDYSDSASIRRICSAIRRAARASNGTAVSSGSIRPVDRRRMGHVAANGERLLQLVLNEIVFPAGILQPPSSIPTPITR